VPVHTNARPPSVPPRCSHCRTPQARCGRGNAVQRVATALHSVAACCSALQAVIAVPATRSRADSLGVAARPRRPPSSGTCCSNITCCNTVQYVATQHAALNAVHHMVAQHDATRYRTRVSAAGGPCSSSRTCCNTARHVATRPGGPPSCAAARRPLPTGTRDPPPFVAAGTRAAARQAVGLAGANSRHFGRPAQCVHVRAQRRALHRDAPMLSVVLSRSLSLARWNRPFSAITWQRPPCDARVPRQAVATAKITAQLCC
jgi:hypothetical protein